MRNRPLVALVWLVALLVPRCTAHTAENQDRSDALIRRIDRAFGEPPTELAPGVVILPALDADRQVRSEGFAISQLAQVALTYAPHKRISVSPGCFRFLLADGGYDLAGRVLSPSDIEAIVAASGCDLWAIPTLTTDGDRYDLSVAIHRKGESEPKKTFRHRGRLTELPNVPGLIALEIADYLRLDLSESERSEMAAAQVHSAEDLVLLSRYLPGPGPERKSVPGFLQRNPRCVPAWNLYLTTASDGVEAIVALRNVVPPLKSDLLRVATARAGANDGRAAQAMRALLKVAPSHHGDGLYFTRLVQTARKIPDDVAVEHLFQIWQEQDPGYVGQLTRGMQLESWAWDARGSGWASSVTQEGFRLFHERLERARRQLEAAIENNPFDWEARGWLLSVGIGLSHSRQHIDDLFAEAVAVNPAAFQAYRAKYKYLQPRWFGTVDDLLEFGLQCYETGYWERGIPQMFYAACVDADRYTVEPGFFERDDVWQVCKEYRDWALPLADARERLEIDSNFAYWGALGGHAEDVIELYRAAESGAPALDRNVFYGLARYRYCRDRVFALAGTAEERLPAQIRVALMAGDFGKVDTLLKTASSSSPKLLDSEELERFSRVAAMGRELASKGTLTITPQEMSEAWTVVNGNWGVEDGKLVSHVPTRGYAAIQCPFGLGQVEIKGTIEDAGTSAGYGIKLHTPSQSATSIFVFKGRQGTLESYQHKTRAGSTTFPPGPQKFHARLLPERDTVSLAGGETVVVGRDQSVPGGMVFFMLAGRGPATIRVSELKITLLKDP